METSFWAEGLKVSHSLHGSGCVGLWTCLQLLQKETPLMTARMSLGPILLLCLLLLCFSNSNIQFDPRGSWAVWFHVLKHSASVRNGFYLVEWALMKLHIDSLFPQTFCLRGPGITCRKDYIQGFVIGLVFKFLFWQCAACLTVPKSLERGGTCSLQAPARLLHVQ